MNKVLLFMIIVCIIIAGWIIIGFVKNNSFIDLFAMGFAAASIFWFGGLLLYKIKE